MWNRLARVRSWKSINAGTVLTVLALAGVLEAGSGAGAEASRIEPARRTSSEPLAATRCNPSKVAEDYWFTSQDPGTVTMWFDTVSEAESYVDPLSRSVYWLVRETRTLKSESFVAGINDLWAVEFYVLRSGDCVPVVTAEH